MGCPNLVLKTRRLELGLTQENVAKYVGVSKGTVSKWEKGEIQSMRSDKIPLVAEILHMTIMEVLEICKPESEEDDSNADNTNCNPDEGSADTYYNPEYGENLHTFRDSDDGFFDSFAFVDREEDGEKKFLIMYQDELGRPLYEEFEKEDYDFIVRTIEMLKSKAKQKK